MLNASFDSTGEGVENFEVKVQDSPEAIGGAHISLNYWVHVPNRAFNTDVDLYLTEEQAVELHRQLDEYLADRKIKAWNDKFNENPAEAAE